MGTRSLIAVCLDGEYKVAQYCQWDGYPEGQGMECLRFLRNDFVEHKFRENLKKLKMVKTDEERNALSVLYENNWPDEFSRDTGAKILKMVQDGEVKSGFLVDNIQFAGQFDCEWAWVIDLDLRTFEAFEGFNKKPLSPFERFYYLGKCPENKYLDNEYFPVRTVKKWSLIDLPSEKEFLKAFEKDEDENEEFNAHKTPIGKALDAGHIYK